MSKEVEIIINTDGTVEIDLHGFHGKGCAEITEKFLKALGKEVKRDQKCEYHKVQQKTKQQQKNA